jgi:hypothetical protein
VNRSECSRQDAFAATQDPVEPDELVDEELLLDEVDDVDELDDVDDVDAPVPLDGVELLPEPDVSAFAAFL